MKMPKDDVLGMASSFLHEKMENIEIHPNAHTGHNALNNAQNILDLDGDGDLDTDDLSEGIEAASDAMGDIFGMIGDLFGAVFS